MEKSGATDGERIRLRLFGVPELRGTDGLVLRFRTRKQLALLVYLAVEARERPVSRDLVADLLWPDVGAERARHSLSQALTAIRSLLGEDAVSRGGDGVRLLAPVVTDLDHLDALGNGAGLEHPLADADKWAGTDFAHWVESAREQLIRRVATALQGDIEAHSASGKLAEAASRARVLRRLDPFSVLAARTLAEAALMNGDFAEAAQLIATFIERTRDELGCEPPPEITRIATGLADGSIHSLLDAELPDTADAPARPRARRFVGREEELVLLDHEWHELAESSPRTCLIVGPAGIGKSTLLRRFGAKLSSRGGSVTLLTCHEIGKDLPFAAAADLIALLLRNPRVSETDPIWLAEASRIHPGVRVSYPGVPSPPPIPASSIPVRVAEAIAQMLMAISDRTRIPLLVDDVANLDQPSRGILYSLLQRITTPLLLVATARTPGFASASWIHVDAFDSVQWSRILRLPPLSSPEMSEFLNVAVAGIQIPDGAVDTIARLADGNPYFASLLLTDLRNHISADAGGPLEWNPTGEDWQPPPDLRRTFTRLSRRLSVNEHEILSLLAVARRGLSINELSAASGASAEDCRITVRQAIHSDVLALRDGQLCFRNELHRSFFYYSLPIDQRRFHHLRVADALASLSSSPDHHRQLEIGHHLLKGGHRARATSVIIDAANEATTRGAPREAQLALEAISSTEAAESFRYALALSKALIAQRRYNEAFAILSNVGRRPLTPRQEAAVAVYLAECAQRGYIGDSDSRAAATEQALELATRIQSEALRLLATQLAAESAAERADIPSLKQFVGVCEETIRSTQDDLTRSLALMTQGYCNMVLGDFEAAAGAFAESAERLAALQADIYLIRPLNGLGMALTACGKVDQASEAFERALKLITRTGDPAFEIVVCGNLGALLGDFGRFKEAARCIEAALRKGEDLGYPESMAPVFVVASSLALDIGDVEQADLILRTAERKAEAWFSEHHVMDLATVRADYYLALGELESAWKIVESIVARRPYYLERECGRQERLWRQYLYNTRGRDALLSHSDEHREWLNRQPLPARLEVELFEVLTDKERRYEERLATTLVEIERWKALGVLSHLAVVGCLQVADHQDIDSPARIAASLLPNLVTGSIPVRLDWSPSP